MNQKEFLDLGGNTVEILARPENGNWAALAFVHGTKTSVRGAVIDLPSCRESFTRSLAAAVTDPAKDEYAEVYSSVEEAILRMTKNPV